MSILISNLKYLRNEKGLTQQQMADQLGIPRPTYSGWERGSAEPSLSSLSTICNIYGVSLDNLVRDKLEDGQSELSVHEQFRVLAVSVDDSNRQLVEFVPERAEAGYVESFSNPDFISDLPKIRIPDMPEGTYRAFEINGESMLPLEPGSVVVGSYIERLDGIKAGKTYIVATKDGIVYKRLRKSTGENYFIAISDNPVFPPFEIHFEDIREIWGYYCHISYNDSPDSNGVDLQMQINRLQEKVDSVFDILSS